MEVVSYSVVRPPPDPNPRNPPLCRWCGEEVSVQQLRSGHTERWETRVQGVLTRIAVRHSYWHAWCLRDKVLAENKAHGGS